MRTSEDGESNFASLILLPAPPSQESNCRNPVLGYLSRLEVSCPPPKTMTFCLRSLSTCCLQDRQNAFLQAQVTLFRQ